MSKLNTINFLQLFVVKQINQNKNQLLLFFYSLIIFNHSFGQSNSFQVALGAMSNNYYKVIGSNDITSDYDVNIFGPDSPEITFDIFEK